MIEHYRSLIGGPTLLRGTLLLIIAVLSLLNLTNVIVELGEVLSNLANFFILAAAIEYGVGFIPKNLYIPIAFEKTQNAKGEEIDDATKPTEWGLIRIYSKDINASNLTNAVSTHFFGGGQAPPPTRQAIIAYTNPKILRNARGLGKPSGGATRKRKTQPASIT